VSLPIATSLFSRYRVPIADIFQTKKRKKRQVPEYEEDVDGDYSDIWGDYYDTEDDKEEKKSSVIYQRPRINFEKYARKQSNDSQAKEVTSSLPDNIYCDLVTTLTDKCIQASCFHQYNMILDSVCFIFT
jgi:hypothetical protein